MKKFLLHFYFRNQVYDSEKEIAKVFEKIYSQRKSSDSPGSFGFERAGKTNSRTLPR